MKTKNGFTVVLTKNEWNRTWPGPWFYFRLGTPTRMEGRASYKTLVLYIGKEAWGEVKKHFKCLKGLV